MEDDDLGQRFNAISIPELRRRVDLAVNYVRELRRSLGVHAGMTLERAPGPIPELDVESAKRAFEEIIEMLPLLRKPLTEEERAAMVQPTEAQREAMKDLVETLMKEPEELEAMAKERGLEISPEKLRLIRDGMIKSEMLGEVQREVEGLRDELEAYKARLMNDVAAVLSRVKGAGGPPS